MPPSQTNRNVGKPGTRIAVANEHEPSAPYSSVHLTGHRVKPSRWFMQGKEGFRGRYWFAESDMKGGGQLRLDKSGKAIITVLRHLGRLNEVKLLSHCCKRKPLKTFHICSSAVHDAEDPSV